MAAMEGPERTGIPALLSRMADSLSRLLSEHITLAQLELKEDAKAFGKAAAMIGACVPFLAVGYLLLCTGLALFLASYLGNVLGFVAVGAGNALVGGVGIVAVLRKLKSQHVLGSTVSELGKSAAVFNERHHRLNNGGDSHGHERTNESRA